MKMLQTTECVRAEIIGSDTCTALGITVRSPSPVLGMCRALVAAGHHPATPLQAWRGPMLCLAIKTIGEAADFEVNAHGTDFIRHRERRPASPVRQTGVPASAVPPSLAAAAP